MPNIRMTQCIRFYVISIRKYILKQLPSAYLWYNKILIPSTKPSLRSSYNTLTLYADKVIWFEMLQLQELYKF